MSLSKQTDVSIVIPAYREEQRIGTTLDTLAVFLKTNHVFKDKSVEVLVVAADSPDKTHEIAIAKQKLFKNFRLLKPGAKAGKGRDVQFGMLRASGKFICFMDADLATPLSHLEEFYMTCATTDSIVVGTRNLLKHHPNPLRRIISNIGNLLFRLVGGVWIEDSQCGFKMFPSTTSQFCFSRLTIMGWGFDMEILAIAHANNIGIKSYRINDWQDKPHTTFTDGLLRISLRSLKDLGHIGLRRLRGFGLRVADADQ